MRSFNNMDDAFFSNRGLKKKYETVFFDFPDAGVAQR